MSAVDVLAVMGDDRYAVPARIKDVIDSLKFDEKMRGHNPDRSTVDFPYAISILEAQAAKIAEVRAAVAELISAVDAFVNYDAMAEGDVSLLDSDKHWDALGAALARCKGGAA